MDFEVDKYLKTFRSSPYYDGKVNGYDLMLMESEKKANQIIRELKKEIDLHKEEILQAGHFTYSYNEEGLYGRDKSRIYEEIEHYCRCNGIEFR